MKKGLLLIALLSLSFALIGCEENTDETDTSQKDDSTQETTLVERDSSDIIDDISTKIKEAFEQ